MLKLNTEHRTPTLSQPLHSEVEPARRLIVPVQNPETDLTAVARRVWQLAEAMGADIEWIGLCSDPTQEPSLRRVLVTLAAMVNHGKVSANTEIIAGKDWVKAIKARCGAGDMVVCWEEPYTSLLRRPLGQLLQSELNIPLYILSGIHAKNSSHTKWPTMIAAWIGFAAIVIGFFLLQVKIDELANHWTITLEIVSTVVEFGLIWFWNNLFS